MSERDEALLVERLKRRDEGAFNEFVRAYEKRVFRLVYRMLNDHAEAEDVSQEVFIAVFKAIGSFRGESKLSTWLYRLAANHCKNRIKYLARRAQGKKTEFDEVAERDTARDATMSTYVTIARPDQEAEAAQLEAILRAAIAELDEDQRELVILRDVENLSYEEIQQITGLPEGTIKSRLHRARWALAKALERATEEPRSSTASTAQRKASSGGGRDDG